MKVTNSRETRSKTLLTLTPDKFETYFDYYVFIHLNSEVVLLHVVGMLLGFIFLALAIIKMSWVYLVLHLISFNLIPQVAHWIYDGIMTPTARGAPLISIWYAIRINMWYLTGRQEKIEKQFIAKYPFTEAYFQKD